MLLRNLSESTTDVLLGSLCQWEQGLPIFGIRDMVPACAASTHRLLQALVSSGAFQGEEGPFLQMTRVESRATEAAELLSRGIIIQCYDEAQNVRFAFDPKRLGDLVRYVPVLNPHPVIHVRPGLALEDMTNMELILTLRDLGWSWSRLPKKKEQRQAP